MLADTCGHVVVRAKAVGQWRCQVCGVPFAPLREPTRHVAGLIDIPTLAESAWCDPDVRRYIDEDKKINAIKEARFKFGVGLKEAKEAVEMIQHWRSLGMSPPVPMDPEDEQRALDSVLKSLRKDP